MNKKLITILLVMVLSLNAALCYSYSEKRKEALDRLSLLESEQSELDGKIAGVKENIERLSSSIESLNDERKTEMLQLWKRRLEQLRQAE